MVDGKANRLKKGEDVKKEKKRKQVCTYVCIHN